MIANNPNILYPNQHQLLVVYDEGSSPHLYNYFCLHGFQVFMNRERKVYKVWCRGWIPHKYKSEYVYSSGVIDYIVYQGIDINHAMKVFRETCLALLGSNRYALYNEKNPLFL